MTGDPVQAEFRFALDEQPKLLSVGEGIKDLLGFSAGDFPASRVSLRDRIHPDDADIAGILFSPLAEDKSGTINIRLRHADGRIRCVRVQYTKEPASAGGKAVLDLLLQDAKSLHETHGEPAALTATDPMMVIADEALYFKNRDHVFTAANRQAELTFAGGGEANSGLVGKTDYDLFPEHYADIYYRHEKKILAGIQAVRETQPLPDENGEKRWVASRKFALRDPDGTIIGLFGVALDVTEQMKAKQALEAAEQEYRSIFDGALEGMFRVSVDGRILIANRAAARILGYDSPQDVLESVKDFRSDIWTDQDERARNLLELRDNEAHAILGFECQFKCKDGTPLWVSLNSRLVFGIDGQPAGYEGFFVDIAERKRAEAALREGEESLEESQRIAGLGSYVTDIHRGTWTSSEVLDKLFGIDKTYERTVEGWGALVHPDDRAGMVGYFADEVVGRKKPFDREYRIVRPSDGAVRWVHGLGRLDFDAQGRPWKMHGTIKDITERKLADVSLRESKELLQLFIEHAPVALSMFDREMRYLAASRRCIEEYGLAGQEIVGRSHYDVLPWVTERLKEIHQRALSGETLRREEERSERPDGTIRWTRWEVRPWRSGEGEIGGIILFTENITEQKKAEAALRESKEVLQLFIEHAPAGLVMFDREMRYLAASRRWLEMHSLLDTDVIGRSHYEIFPELPESWKEEHRRALAGEPVPADERSIRKKDGSTQWVRREVIPWWTSEGAVGGIIILSEDITERRQIEERLRLAASVFTNASEGIMITDPEGAILEVNEMFTRITGYSREEVIGRNPRLLKSNLQSPEFYEELWRTLLQEGQWSGEVWNRTKGAEIVAVALSISAVHDSSGNLLQYVSMFSDVTELKEHQRQIEHVTHYDVLTGLPNRALFADRLRQAMTQASQQNRLLAVAYLDLDGFKNINDRHGQGAGDRLLTSLAFNMKCALRKGDTLARLGGDEFVAVMLDLDSAKASMPVLKRLLEAAAEPVQVGDLPLSLTASIGVAFYPQGDEADADSLLRQADQAMYEAKLAGGNRYHIFDPGRDHLVRGRHEDLEHIRLALDAREFVLYYQPKVNMRTGKVVGAEALIRWQHPERGLLPPGMFLPVIEDHPLAIDLGEWVIDSALAQVEAWDATGLELPVSVNMGALQLQQADFADRLSRLLAAHPRVKPSRLELEVLETSALQDVAQTSQVLHACHQLGVSFALDDFGTGYSSLTYLKRLPASVLKIDQSFVSDMLDDPENLNILEGVLGLASAFHREVIAEGVETVEHGLMLLQLGCELAQGYGIARPMPARDLPGWVSGWRPDPRWAKVPRIHPGNRALLYASVEHRAWVEAFEAFLQGKRHAPPSLDRRQCRLGMWLDAEEQAGRDEQPAYRSVETVHRQFHELAAEILSSVAQGRTSEGLGRLGELHGLRNDLLEQLDKLSQEC
jgi:diguanylate cyclase (GGDEF)-like protein/PAS domain S-box-containing protein